MKIHPLSVQISAGVACAFLFFGIGKGHAASAPPMQNAGDYFAQPSPFQQVAWEQTRIETLQHAYHLLEHADGDYKGHRVAAMRSIKKAAAILGVDLKGEGHAEESQWASDRKLQEAKSLLEGLVDANKGKEQPHINRAIKELNTALATK